MNDTTKRKCILHVGTMKTGTTTVQSWLAANKDQLVDQGWTYAGWPCRSSAHIKRIVEQLPPDQNLIISDEGLWHHSGTKSDTTGVAKALKDFDVMVLVYCRRPDDFLESWFKQGIKFGQGTLGVQDFLASHQVSPAAFERRLNTFTKIFGKQRVQIVPYERAQMRNGDILDDFLYRTGIPGSHDHQKAEDQKNISPSAEQMLLTALVRSSFNADQALLDSLMVLTPHPDLTSGRTSIFTPREKQKIRDAYFPLFQKIQREFNSGASPNFFLNWGAEDKPSEVSPIRAAYDQLFKPKEMPQRSLPKAVAQRAVSGVKRLSSLIGRRQAH